MTKTIKVAISQRIIPHYRVPVFRLLGSFENIDLTVFYGAGFKSGSQVNSNNISGFNHKKLFTINLSYSGIYKSKQLRVWHPSLFFHLIYGNFDVVIVEPSTNFYNDLFAFAYCKIFRKKFIWYESGSVPKDQRPLFRKLIDPIISIFIRKSDAFITYNSFADNSLIRDFKIPINKIFRAQNTLDISSIEQEIPFYSQHVEKLKTDLNIKDCFVALYIGGIEKRKKIELLIKAVTQVNNKIKCKVLIVGDGPDQNEIINSLSDEEKNITVFAGKHINDSTLYILASDVVILPSSGGLSVLQAFACSKPFIGSEDIEHGGIKDYVDHGKNGYLFEEDNQSELANYINILASSSELYQSFSNNAKTKSKSLTIQNMVSGIYNSIIYTTKYEDPSNK